MNTKHTESKLLTRQASKEENDLFQEKQLCKLHHKLLIKPLNIKAVF